MKQTLPPLTPRVIEILESLFATHPEVSSEYREFDFGRCTEDEYLAIAHRWPCDSEKGTWVFDRDLGYFNAFWNPNPEYWGT